MEKQNQTYFPCCANAERETAPSHPKDLAVQVAKRAMGTEKGCFYSDRRTRAKPEADARGSYSPGCSSN